MSARFLFIIHRNVTIDGLRMRLEFDTHLTNNTRIPPTKITRPIKGIILEIEDAVNTTELITFIIF